MKGDKSEVSAVDPPFKEVFYKEAPMEGADGKSKKEDPRNHPLLKNGETAARPPFPCADENDLVGRGK